MKTDNIIEKNRAKLPAQEIATLFQQLMENIREVLWIVSPDWQEVIYVSPGYEGIWGQSCESLYARPLNWFDAVLEVDREPLMAALQRKSAGDFTDVSFPEFRIRRPDGTERWIAVRAFPVLDAAGKVYRIAGIAEDISERKQADLTLKYERDIRQCYIDATQTLLVALDRAGRISMINRASCKLLGYSEYELLGRDWFTTCLPKSISEADVRSVFHKLVAGEVEVVEYHENPVLCRDGREHLIAWYNTVLNNERGEIIGILASGEDITDRKQVEAELRIAAVAFEADEGIVVTNAQGAILRVNHAFTQITGYSAEAAVGQTMRLLKSGRHDGPFYAAMWDSIVRQGTWTGEVWNRRKGGELYLQHQTISAIKDSQGEITHYVAVQHDITQRKEMEEQINQLAFYDTLTRLPNRRLLDDRLRTTIVASRRSGRDGAVLFLDLDNFKSLNDTHGHRVGDLLLVEAAHRMRGCVREVDTVARFGGDEFVVVLSELDEVEAACIVRARNVADKILAALSKPYVLAIVATDGTEQHIQHRCGVSIGVAPLKGDVSTEDVLKWADIAMYQAKASGRNAVCVYDAERG